MFLDIIISLIMIGVGGYIIYEASTYPDYSMLTPVSSDVFPKIMGWVMVICALIVLGNAVYKLWFSKDKEKYREQNRTLAEEIKTRFIENKRNLPTAIGIPVLMLAYALLLETVGFEILSVLFLFFSLLLCRERSPVKLILIPIVGTAVMYYIFHVLLKIMVPLMFLK